MRSLANDDGDFKTICAAEATRQGEFPQLSALQGPALDLLGHTKAGLLSAGERSRLWRLAMSPSIPTARDFAALRAITTKLGGRP